MKEIYNVFLQRQQIKYTDDPAINLQIISLKKLINEFHNENQLLKKMNLQFEKKEVE